MAEILTWPEGTAVFWSGNGANVTAFFARDVRLSPQRQTYRYRPPFSPTHVHVDLQGPHATVALGLAESPQTRALKAMLAAATPGTVHCHVFANTPGVNASGGFYAYSGTLEGGEIAGNEGQGEQRFSLQGWFETWSAY